MLKNLTIAVQSSGRLREPSLEYLRALGLDTPTATGRMLLAPCANPRIKIAFVRHRDIPFYVAAGRTDLGIVGANIVAETELDNPVLEQLDFGRCALVLAVPVGGALQTLSDLNNQRIATSYPASLKRFLEDRNITAEVIELRGSVEVAPHLGLADAVCDITQTGATLRANKLKIIAAVYESNAVVIINNKLMATLASPTITSLLKQYENLVLQPALQ